MNTKELLVALEQLAKAAKELVKDTADFNEDGKINWEDLVAASKDAKFRELVDHVLGQLGRADVYSALLEIDKKKKLLANNRSYAEMSSAELDEYSALRDTEDILYRAVDKIERGRGQFVGWLVDDALPVLANVLKIVIPLF